MSSAAAEEKNESSNAASAVASSAGGGKLVLTLTLVNLAVTLGMVGVLWVSFKRESAHPLASDINARAEAGAGSKSSESSKEGAKEGGKEEGKEESTKGEGAGSGKEKPKSTEFGRMITLDQFTVNLTAPGSSAPRFVRVNVSLEAPNEDIEGEVNAKIPQVRNAIIDLFNSKRPSDLATAEGRDALKEEIKNALNGFLTRGKIKGVFFTNFVLGS